MDDQSTSLWEANRRAPAFDPLRGELAADVCIVGAGITGLTAALLLRERGRSVVVLERARVGGGETGNTTAHITESLDARYHYIRRKYGQEEAKLVASSLTAAKEKIAELVSTHAIDCDFRRVSAYLYTEKRKYVSGLKSEATAAREAGLAAQWITDVPLPFVTRGAVRFDEQAQFHPLAYLDGIARAAVAAGAVIHERSSVREVGNGLVTTDGGSVRAKQVILATNIPIEGFNTIHLKAAAYRSYAIAIEARDGDPDGLFWDTADPYHYTRRHVDVLIVGGEDHRVGEEDGSEGAFARLEEYARQCYGERAVRHRWSGQIIEPHGGLPFIGGDGSVFLATGYAGQGMTFGTAAAMLLADLLTGVDNPAASLFDPMRVRSEVTSKEFITENLGFPARLIADRLTPHDVEGLDAGALRSGEARIIAAGGKKVAAYRDEAGTLFTVSAVCTHMKCDVAWNAAERTWDCPCHGSRYKPDGAVLNGPAREGLASIDSPDES
ncbi:MAG TPA: FAD-dependent oxidoreductase [Thermoanaerobaculia bacterium]|jgi:glycine/D-amino acid oxidase-like deaminating enzyme/nitrite reductase/ring-hydroxylating ferredoxin subunit